jgi:hypothetical protein
MKKHIDIETQSLSKGTVETLEVLLRYYELGRDTGHEYVRDHWGHKAYDEIPINDAIENVKSRLAVLYGQTESIP